LRSSDETREGSPLTSLYVHIPFCERKCLYCDFYSVQNTALAEDFLTALTREIALRQAVADPVTFETVFFGGGTPSLLTPRQLELILSRLHAAFQVAPDAEVTLETNPGTVTEDKLRTFRTLGVNRLSIGIQSFHDPDLIFLGRIHNREEALRCLDLAGTAGFDNVSIDLIYSIPGQTLLDWEDNLRTAVHLVPQHIAAYSLIVEDNTPLARMVETGEVRANSPDLEARMYERTIEVLSGHGYEHYEVSNYALAGFRCRHNCAYWSHEDYLGLGPSAHSFRQDEKARTGTRWWNVAELATYVDRLSSGALPVASEECIGLHEMINERIFLGLRSSGLDLARLRIELGYDLAAEQGGMLRWLVEEKLAHFEGPTLKFTPQGYVLCDEICRRLLQHVGP
jgi:oxygen-independent coproporphyrinogen-3 oxidase